MSFNEFIKVLDKKDKPEGNLVETILYSLLISIIILAIFYFVKLRYIENFIPKYGFFLILTILSYAIIFPSIKQVRAYGQFACMSGMMIGMTTGMIAGFLPGYFIGATNGMFWGSVFGMSVGIFMGIWNGKCCGIMGIMEGLMAGFMGGLMGAMTGVMMMNDHLRAGGIIVFIISSMIIFSLNYMIYKEMKEYEEYELEDSTMIVLISAIMTTLTIVFMVFGPRSVLFG